jgi:Cof subfamily protein (haloacid dehalogenase superfamily)
MKLFVSDIDGTLTHGNEPISIETVNFLKKKQSEGYQIILITGRNFSFIEPLLKNFDFSYYLGLYNGSLLLSMPSKVIIHKKYLQLEKVIELSSIFEKYHLEFIVESGIEDENAIYFRKDKFSSRELSYLSLRQISSNDVWRDIKDFHEIKNESVPILKCFAEKTILYKLKEIIESLHEVHITIIEDPFKVLYALLLTHSLASKGQLLKSFINNQVCHEIIVCGNDLNDLTMLEMATKKVVIEGSPQELLDIADVIAKKPQEGGIIEVLK